MEQLHTKHGSISLDAKLWRIKDKSSLDNFHFYTGLMRKENPIILRL